MLWVRHILSKNIKISNIKVSFIVPQLTVSSGHIFEQNILSGIIFVAQWKYFHSIKTFNENKLLECFQLITQIILLSTSLSLYFPVSAQFYEKWRCKEKMDGNFHNIAEHSFWIDHYPWFPILEGETVIKCPIVFQYL